MADDTLRYSDADLAEFKELIINKIHKAQTDFWATTHSNASKRPFKQSFYRRSSQRARTHLQQRVGRFKRSASVRVIESLISRMAFCKSFFCSGVKA